MKSLRFWRDAAGAAMAFLVLQTLQAHLLQEALRQQDQVLVHRLEAGAAEILNEAHKANDDLAIYHVVHALEHSPGVIEARIRKPGEPGYPMRDSIGEWGRLKLSMSNRLSRQLIRRQWSVGTLILSFLWMLTALYLYGMERQRSHLHAKLDEFQGLLEAEKRQLASAEEREQVVAQRGTAALQQALQRIPEPLIILNSQQRIWALNQAAADRLEMGPIEAVLKKSWQEIPILQSCGHALEQSLASPGRQVEWSDEMSGLRLTFETDPGDRSGTWVVLHPSKQVVE